MLLICSGATDPVNIFNASGEEHFSLQKTYRSEWLPTKSIPSDYADPFIHWKIKWASTLVLQLYTGLWLRTRSNASLFTTFCFDLFYLQIIDHLKKSKFLLSKTILASLKYILRLFLYRQQVKYNLALKIVPISIGTKQEQYICTIIVLNIDFSKVHSAMTYMRMENKSTYASKCFVTV